ncbi:hypothetical protein TWF281_005291 [Arthrobotrys megalospora]
MDPNQTPSENSHITRPRRHSDPLNQRTRQKMSLSLSPASPSFSGTTYTSDRSTSVLSGASAAIQTPPTDPLVTAKTLMHQFLQIDRCTHGDYPVLDQPTAALDQFAPDSIDEINRLMQNCHVTSVHDNDRNRAFLGHFGIPVADWSLGLIGAARQTGNLGQLARVYVVLDHFGKTGRNL